MIEWLFFTALAPQPVPVGDPLASSAKIDILRKQPRPSCEAQSAEEIVVCAVKTDNESQRLRPIANAHNYAKDETRTEFGISENVRMAAEVDSNQLSGGVVSKSIMARVKIAF